ncbi:hypothetical protein R3P38DRAFT_3201379 [Favolaschia claudopus]|uniref:Uncharacterized protein n=1 Tax=Favolaschia claudopus TaxID=2862362 RepID=A0AAW0AWL6_9AGAR
MILNVCSPSRSPFSQDKSLPSCALDVHLAHWVRRPTPPSTPAALPTPPHLTRRRSRLDVDTSQLAYVRTLSIIDVRRGSRPGTTTTIEETKRVMSVDGVWRWLGLVRGLYTLFPFTYAFCFAIFLPANTTWEGQESGMRLREYALVASGIECGGKIYRNAEESSSSPPSFLRRYPTAVAVAARPYPGRLQTIHVCT